MYPVAITHRKLKVVLLPPKKKIGTSEPVHIKGPKIMATQPMEAVVFFVMYFSNIAFLLALKMDTREQFNSLKRIMISFCNHQIVPYDFILCQIVEIKQYTSIYGVEQGVILGPILFKPYILM